MSREQYVNEMLPYAMEASSATGINPHVIVAQWAHETGYGTSAVSRNNNHGGIKYIDGRSPYQSGEANGHATFDSIEDFVKDYIRVVNLSYYDAVRSAAGVEATIQAFHKSPYATDPNYGDKVLKHYGIVSKMLGDTVPGVSLEKYKSEASNLSESKMIEYAAVGLLAVAAIKTID